MKKMLTTILALMLSFSMFLEAAAMESIPEETTATETLTEEVPVENQMLRTSKTSAEMITNQYVLIKLASEPKWIWNMNSSGTMRNDCVHLDDNTGFNCTMQLKLEEDKGTKYYSIRYSKSDFYIDSERDDAKTDRVLHNGEKKRNQDNQLFRFVPVTDSNGNVKKDTYYIMSKKGDNANKDLYIGLDDDKGAQEGRKVATTSKKVEWIVQSALGDVDPNAVKLPTNGNYATTCMIYPNGYKRDVNLQGDEHINGMDMQLWLHGTSSKVNCFWDENYKAYKLTVTEVAHNACNAHNYSWDVENRSFTAGKQIHIWKDDKHSMSQYWRFIKNSDGTYYIQNPYTGLYAIVEGTENGENQDFDGSNLVTGTKPMKWRISILNGEIGTSVPTDWMSAIPGDRLLSQISIPGTHDTGAAMTVLDGAPQISIARCQQMYLEEQLNVGVRALDVRCNSFFDHGNPVIVHGGNYAACLASYDITDILNIDDVVRICKEFLIKHPTETIVVIVKKDGTCESSQIAEALDKLIQNNSEYVYLAKDDHVPTLDEVRGKMVFMRRFEFDGYDPESPDTYFGPYLKDWDTTSYDDIKAKKGALKMYTGEKSEVWVQDAYKEDAGSAKRDYVKGTINQMNDANNPVSENAYYINYLSSTSPTVILNATREINSWWLSRDMLNFIDGKFLGMVMLNYADEKLARSIYQRNDFEQPVIGGEQIKPDEDLDDKPAVDPDDSKPEDQPGDTKPDTNPDTKPEDKPDTEPEKNPTIEIKPSDKETGNAADTGDEANIGFYVGVCVVAVLAVIAALWFKKKRK